MTKLKLLTREDGQAMVEYALIVALLSVTCIVILTALGQDINAILAFIDSAIQSAIP